jgi:hypothetical protein
MTRREMMRRFSCVNSKETAIRMADFSQQKNGARVQMVVVKWGDDLFIVFNEKTTSRDFDVVRTMPVVYQAKTA